MRYRRLVATAALMYLLTGAVHAAENPALNDLADQIMVERLLVAYLNANDSGDVERLRKILSADAQMSIQGQPIGAKGRDAMVETYQRDQRNINPGRTPGQYGVLRHICTNIEVEVRGDSASASCYEITTAFNKAAQRPEILSVGRYAIESIKEDGRWYIRKLDMRYDQGNDDLAKALQLGPHHPPSDELPESLRKK